MKRMLWVATIIAFLFPASGLAAENPSPFGIPYKPDPPPAIDGQLDDWKSMPGEWTVNRKEQVIYGQGKWKSPQDLCARIKLAWREDYLYLAAEVTDDYHRQRGRGQAMFRGDHVTLYLDAAPDVDPKRMAWGEGQVQFGFSPGSLENTGDPLVDLPPEAVVFTPEGQSAEGILVAARKTDSGYTLEAAVPWSLIGRLAGHPKQRATIGLPLGVEVGISDCDAPDPTQEKMMTLGSGRWERYRDRMQAGVLAASDGKALVPSKSQEILATATLAPGKQQQLTVPVSAVPESRDLVLLLKARLQTPRVAGYTHALQVELNGTPVDPSRLVNWEHEELHVTGRVMSRGSGNTFNVPYAPDFDSPNTHPSYALKSGPKLCRYELRITDLVRTGDNRLVISNRALPQINRDLIVGDVRLEIRAPQVSKAKRPAPTGPLDVYRPVKRMHANYAVQPQADGTLQLTIGDATFRVTSEFSTPKPAWVQGSNPYFDFAREIERRNETIILRDTFTNRTDENLPLIQRHRVAAPERFQKVWLAGISPSSLTSQSAEPAHPTCYGQLAAVGIGLLAIDDVMQVHVTNYTTEDSLVLADNHFVLKPRSRHTAEWAIVPTVRADYWDFVNAVRRLRDVNFTLDGSFAFLRSDARTPVGKWTDQQFVDFIGFKSAKFVCSGISSPRYKGRYPHGTAFQAIDWSYDKRQLARIRSLMPNIKLLKYFHCFIDVRDESPEQYHDARLLRTDGTQADYGSPHDRIFVPTEHNTYGREVMKNVNLILAPQPAGLGCDGVYWDEFEYSRYPYTYGNFTHGNDQLPWDGASADIDPKRLKITRLKSSATLISQPWRVALARRILNGHPLIANGQPHTKTMTELHFPRFVETGSISNCALAQLYSPIALGDHLTERSEQDAYRVMLRALDFGCLYYWYNDLTVIPTHRHLTFYMFPTTIVEIHEGYVLGQERILTNRSGLFGWDDAADFDIHVFDDQGREVPDFKAAKIVQDGKTFAELRLPEDYSAAIVRKMQ